MKAKFNIDRIREIFRERRARLEMTQDELGARVGWTKISARAIVHRIENGPRNLMLEEYVRICCALEIAPWRPLKDGQIVIPIGNTDAQIRILELERENAKLKTALEAAGVTA